MMRRGKLIICLFTAIFLAVAVFCGIKDPSPPPPLASSDKGESTGLSVLVSSGERTEEIALWQDADGACFLFLPGYAELEQSRFVLQPGSGVCLDGQTVENGVSCAGFRLNEAYALSWMNERQEEVKTELTFLRSGQVPAVYVDVRSGDMAYIHQAKGNEEPGALRIYTPDGALEYSGSLEAVKGRGNATWDNEKKPYSLKLRAEADILQMGQAQNWILLPNCMDPTNLRNKVVYDAAQEVGMPYTPDSQWVDLYLNGKYAGLYLLCEKNEVHSRRVDLQEEKSFLVSREKTDRVRQQDLPHITTDAEVYLRVHHSDGDLGALQRQWQSAENAILAENGIDPVTGARWTELIDLDSWVKKYLIEEVFGNLDAGAISQFFYCDDGGKIFAGPVWDYDMSMGNTRTWQIDTPNMLYAGRPHLWNENDTSWYYALYQKQEFRERLRELYEALFRPVLEDLLNGRLQQYSDLTAQAAEMNRIRWSAKDPAEASERMREYMSQRMAFLDSLWLEDAQYHTVEVWINEHIAACYAVSPGETIPYREVPYGTETLIYEGWYDAETEELFDFAQPVTKDKFVYLRETNLNEAILGVKVKGGLTSAIKYVPTAVLLALLSGILAGDLLRRGKRRDIRVRKHELETET